MGTNIHLVVERLADRGGWCVVEPPSGRRWGWYSDRNYAVFTMLCGVRNRWDIVPIAPPRGVPMDSPTRKGEMFSDLDREGYHSLSWVSLDELLSYAWGATVTGDGVITLESYRTWRVRGGHPGSFAGSVFGGGAITVDRDVADRMLDHGIGNDELQSEAASKTYVRVSWNQPYRELASNFYERFVLGDLRQLASPGGELAHLMSVHGDAVEAGHPEAPKIWDEAMRLASCVRIVFGFDS
jgi:hypothetical protein